MCINNALPLQHYLCIIEINDHESFLFPQYIGRRFPLFLLSPCVIKLSCIHFFLTNKSLGWMMPINLETCDQDLIKLFTTDITFSQKRHFTFIPPGYNACDIASVLNHTFSVHRQFHTSWKVYSLYNVYLFINLSRILNVLQLLYSMNVIW